MERSRCAASAVPESERACSTKEEEDILEAPPPLQALRKVAELRTRMGPRPQEGLSLSGPPSRHRALTGQVALILIKGEKQVQAPLRMPPPRSERAALAHELRRFAALALPSAARGLLELVPWLVSLAIVGRLGTRELAALSLVETWTYVPMVIVWQAVGATQSTLVSQAHGARSVAAMRGWTAISLAGALALVALVAALWSLTRAALTALGFDAALVALGYEYVLLALPALLFSSVNTVAAVHLGSMQAPGVPTAIALAECVLDLPITYLLVFGLPSAGMPGLGLPGSALGWTCSSAITTLLYLPALRWAASGGRELAFGGDDDAEDEEFEGAEAGEAEAVATAATAASECEGPAGAGSGGSSGSGDVDGAVGSGGSVRTFLRSRRRWAIFGAQFAPNLVSAVLSTCQYQAISFLAASLGAVDIAAHNTAIALFEVAHTLAVGMMEAASVRVGYHLGCGNAVAARRAALVAVAAAAAAGAVISGAGFALRAFMGRVFSDDPSVVGLIESLAAAFWASFAILSTGVVASGVLEGQGRATAQLVPNLLGSWGVGVALAVASWRLTGLGLRGLWLAMLAGNGAFTALTLLFVARSDWAACVAAARGRAEAEEGEAAEELRESLLARG
jgi:Na+-driven multidrug efflux pump